MRVGFKVTGRTQAEIESSALDILERFQNKGAAAVDFDVHPFHHEFGTEHPVLWEADVTAEIKETA